MANINAGRLHTFGLQIVGLIAAFTDFNPNYLIILEDIPHEHGHIRCDCITDAVGQARVGFIYIVNANLVAFMTAAFKEYTSETLKKQKRESVRQKLEKVKEELSNHRQLKKEKKREQEPIR